MKFEIESYWNGGVLFSIETDSFKLAVEAAVRSDADLRDANLRGADLRGADLRDADLRGADLRDADLRDADLRDANLRGADLRGADLRGADLRGADLRDADLRDANLRDADLRDANLRDADLRDANLRGADLRDANLRGADLRGADLRGAKGVTPQVLQIIGTRHMLMVREYGKIQIGCMIETPEWWDEHREAIGRKEGYSDEQIAEYGDHIASARRFMTRYSLMKAPK